MLDTCALMAMFATQGIVPKNPHSEDHEDGLEAGRAEVHLHDPLSWWQTGQIRRSTTPWDVTDLTSPQSPEDEILEALDRQQVEGEEIIFFYSFEEAEEYYFGNHQEVYDDLEDEEVYTDNDWPGYGGAVSVMPHSPLCIPREVEPPDEPDPDYTQEFIEDEDDGDFATLADSYIDYMPQGRPHPKVFEPTFYGEKMGLAVRRVADRLLGLDDLWIGYDYCETLQACRARLRDHTRDRRGPQWATHQLCGIARYRERQRKTASRTLF